ncbi:efflux RND transporter periplasmic adaptor subunit [Thermodesulfobacteriota bacterium]
MHSFHKFLLSIRWNANFNRKTVALLILLLFAIYPNAARPQQQKGKGGQPPALVEVTEVIEKEVLTQITLVGTAEPWLETVVASEEAGVVRRMLVEEGDRVRVTQPLCEQDTTQLQLKIKAARADLDEAEILQVQAQREWERQKRLYKINSVAEKAYDDARFNLEALKKKAARLEADLNALKDQLGKKLIKAPVAGYVVKRYCLVGQWLGEGEPVATLVVPDPMRVRVPVPERYIQSVSKGDFARVTFDALPDRTFKGKIIAVIPKADEAARTFPVRIEISNKKSIIKAGMLGRATIPLGNPHKAILVPKDALVLSSSGMAIYVVDRHSVRFVPVKTGPAHGALIEILGDLKAGDLVVVRGNERLRPGQTIRIKQNIKPSIPAAAHETG